MESRADILEVALSHLTDFTYIFDLQGRFIYANKALLELWGLSLDQAVGRNFFDLDYPNDLAERLQAQIAQVIKTRQTVTDETAYTSPTGVKGYYEYIFNPVFDGDGRVKAVAGTTHNITARKQAEDASRQLAAIVESSDDAIISKDLNGIITSWNDGAINLFGYQPEEVIGHPMLVIIPPDRQHEEPGILENIRNGRRLSHYETVRRRKDGSLVDVSLTVSPIKDLKGRIIGASKIARDITERRRADRELKESRDAAEAANSAKDRFLAVLSHELRTPLTPVLMTVTAMEFNQDLPAELQEDISMIRRNVELEIKLIDDLLDVSRMISGKLSLLREPVDFNKAVHQVFEICHSQVMEKGIHVQFDLDQNAGCVNADPARLQQILWNLLKNAVKFTPDSGNIRLSTASVPGGRVKIQVADTGIGIEAGKLPLIFDAFEQGGASITQQFGGMGLGLAITKALVELHDGSICVQSDGMGKGTIFTVEFPGVAMSEKGRSSSQHIADTNHRPDSIRLLVVEDHQDTARLLGRLLGNAGYKVEVAGDVAKAMEIASREVVDVLISDVGLPDATGYELMQRIRRLHPGIKGIAMSGYGMDEDVHKSLAAGFSEHLTKPVNIPRLKIAIERVCLER